MPRCPSRRSRDSCPLDAEVLVALGSAAGDALGVLPGNVHVESFVDQAWLMLHLDLVVHHGASGMVLAALTSTGYRRC